MPDVGANPLHVIQDTSPGPHGYDYEFHKNLAIKHHNEQLKKMTVKTKRIKIRDL